MEHIAFFKEKILTRAANILAVGIVLTLTLSLDSQAAPAILKENILAEENKSLLFSETDSNYDFHLTYFYNQHGEKEVQVTLTEAHWLAKDTQLVVLRGRDLNEDGLIETWFFNEGLTVKSRQIPSSSENSWPVIQSLLKEFSLNESRWIGNLAARELLGSLFITASAEIKQIQTIEERLIDLMDIDYRISDLQASQRNPFLLKELQLVSSKGWAKIIEDISKTQIQERNQNLIADAILFVGGGTAFKGLEFLISKSLTGSMRASIQNTLQSSISNINQWIDRVRQRILPGVGQGNELAISKTLGKRKFTQNLTKGLLRFRSESEALEWTVRDNFLTRSLKKVGSLAKETARGAWDSRSYIALSQTLQIAIESYSRGYWNFSDAPLILEHPVTSTQDFFQQVGHDKDMKQNVGYMTLQTTLLSGVSTALDKNGAKAKVKFAVCSAITLIDSATVNIFIQGKTDVPRIAFDTGWELLIGGSQVQLDLHAMRWAQSLADKFKNPKLKLVGYLLATADQLAGYVGYNKATGKLFEEKNSSKPSLEIAPSVVLVPVLAPSQK